MIHSFLVSAILLTLPAQSGGRAHSMLGGKPAAKAAPKAKAAKAAPKAKAVEKPAPSPKSEDAEGSPEALAEYNALMVKPPKTVAGHSKLAAWCEEHGLKAEARLHYAEVVRLNPKHDSAWRKLGYRKVGRRWMTDAQIADAEVQKKADRSWAPRLRKIHRDIHGSRGAKKRDQARAEFEAIRDVRAIPSLYREFGGSPTDQFLLIRAFERIDKPLATRSLAMMAIYGMTTEVRRSATEILRGRDAGEFLEMLVGLLVDTFKFEVKPVAGPGSPGVLFVEGERFNMARFYAPPPPPGVMLQVGDVISYDRIGMPVINRYLGNFKAGVPGSATLAYDFQGGNLQFSASQMIMEAQKGAAAAEAQLEGDVAQVKAINADRRHFNELVMATASYATGKNPGPTPVDWRTAVAGVPARNKYGKADKPTLTELVPLAYRPVFAQLSFLKSKIIPDG